MSQENNVVLTEAEQLLIDSIKGIKQVSGQAIDFAKEQVPDVLHQLLLWNLTSSIIWALLGLFLIIIWAWIAYHDTKDQWSGGEVTALSFILLVPAGCSVFVSNLLTAIKIYVAPKVWLLEYASSLLKG